jgi:transposase
VSCYEAGQDGFYPHRELSKRSGPHELGIDNGVVDSASIQINRRRPRAKTDGLDLDKRMELLVRNEREGERVWSECRIPTIAQEDSRRVYVVKIIRTDGALN